MLGLKPDGQPVPMNWEWHRVDTLATERRERAGELHELPVLSVTKHQGIVRAEDYFKKAVHGRDTANYKVVRREQFAYATIHLDEGSIGLLTKEAAGIVSPMYTVFEPTASVDKHYLLTMLKSAHALNVYRRLAEGTVNRRASIGFDSLGGLHALLPPLPEQRKIAAILSSVDEVIAKTEGVIEQLQAVKKAMMQELLIRGLPGRHTRFKKTEIGEIPEEWQVVTIADIPPNDRPCAQTGPFGQQLGAEDFTSTGIPVLKIGNVRWGSVDLNDLDYVSDAKAQALARFAVREGDLLFARQGATTGRNALADVRCAGALINYHIIRVSVDQTRCDPRFLSICFNSSLVQDQVGRDKQRGNRDGINTRQILSFKFPLPSLAEQRVVSDAIDTILLAAKAHNEELTQLRRTKSALMSVLLTGELRVTPEGDVA